MQRCIRQVWPPQLTLVMVIPALAIALMMLVADVAVLHCVVLPTLLEEGKEKGKNNQWGKPYVERNNERDTCKWHIRIRKNAISY